jgi:26S proteasome regulatory subunit T5
MESTIEIPEEVMRMSTGDIQTRNRLIEGDLRVMKSEILRLQHEVSSMKERLQDNLEKIKLNKQLPYLVSNVVELLDVDPEDDEDAEEGANVDLDSQRKGKCAVVKTSTRTVLLCLFLYTSILCRHPFCLLSVWWKPIN